MSWSSVDEIESYITKLIEIGIDVPADVRAAIARLMERQREVHGK